MTLAIVDLIAAAVVAGGDAGGDAEHGERLQARVDFSNCRRRPVRIVFSQAPTDGKNNRGGGSSADDLVDEIDPAFLSEGGEVDEDVRAGTESGDDLHIHIHFDTGFELLLALLFWELLNLLQGVGRRADGHSCDLWHGAVVLGAEGLEIGVEISAVEFGDGDLLTLSGAGGEVVARFEVGGSERLRGLMVSGCGGGLSLAVSDAALIEAEYAGDDAIEVGGNLELALTAAKVSLLGIVVDAEVGLKSFLHGVGGAADAHAARDERDFLHFYAVLAEGRGHFVGVGLLGAVARCQQVATERLCGQGAGIGNSRAAQREGDFNVGGGVDVGDAVGVGLFGAVVTFQKHVFCVHRKSPRIFWLAVYAALAH